MAGVKGTRAQSKRNRTALKKRQLLADYAKISSKRSGAAVATALRVGSSQYLDVIAAQGSHGRMTWADVRQVLKRSDYAAVDRIDAESLAQIGRVLLLQQSVENAFEMGVLALESSTSRMPINQRSLRYRKLLVQALFVSGAKSKVKARLDDWPDVDEDFYGYIRSDLDNPTITADHASDTRWLAAFNRPFIEAGYSPVSLNGYGATLFDMLTGTPRESQTNAEDDAETHVGESVSEPLVSVVLTTFNPGLAELLTSVRSILNQSLRDIELIIVDDGSDAKHRRFVQLVSGLDERIRVIDCAINGGTYVARNLGISQARGRYITGQDDDDWSHPERLARQVRYLQDHPEVSGCRVSCITTLPNLTRVRLGYTPFSSNASSLMMERALFEKLGGFVRARRGADTELVKRAERVSSRPVVDLSEPLTIVRILEESLSREDFRAGWSHPARRAFKNTYEYWHETANVEDLCLRDGKQPSISVPRRFAITERDRSSRYDVVLAGDWRKYGGPQKSMIEEIRALVADHLNVGVMHLEAGRFMTTKVEPLTPHIQELINRGVVDEVLYDETVEVDLLILRYPPILQFALTRPSNLTVGRMWILANQAPSELDGSDIRYLVENCATNARSMFSVDPIWVPQGPQVRAAIEPYLQPHELASFDVPGILDPAEWYVERSEPRSLIPIVGRHSRNDRMKWPEDKDVIELVYPTSGTMDIRILGGASVPLATLERNTYPAAWTVFDANSVAPESFLATLDFYVFFQHSVAVEAFGRAVLEAIASGVVVVLPAHYEEVFGRAAVYAEPHEVIGVVTKFHQDWHLYRKQVDVARDVIERRFSYAAYQRLIRSVLAKEQS